MQEPLSQDRLSAALSGSGMTVRFFLLFALCVVVAIAMSGWRETLDGLARISVAKILILCGIAFAHYIIRALRWHLIVRAGKVQTTFSQNTLHFFGGFAMTATPGRVGELVRLRWLGRDSGHSFGRLLPIVFADRAVELAAMVLLISLALLLVNLGTVAVWWLLGIAAGLTWIVCRPKVLERILVGVWELIGNRFARLFVRLRRMIRRLEPFMRPSILAPAILLGVVGWALEGVAFYTLLGWLNVSLSVWMAIAIFLIAVLSGALSGLPGGLGGTEVSAVALLLLQGVAPETAVLATIIIRVTTLWFAILIGLIAFPIAEIQSGQRVQNSR